MKIKTCFNLFLTLASICVLLTCCKKGDTGPAGPAGPPGPTGATGSPGAKGDTGTANVIYSAWLDVAYRPDTFRNGTALDTAGFFANINAPKLTNAILTSGEMKVYLNLGTAAAPDIIALPHFDIYNSLNIVPEFLLNRIFIYSDYDISTVTQNNQKILQHRYILIPGSVPGRTTTPVDMNDYNKVKAFYKIPD